MSPSHTTSGLIDRERAFSHQVGGTSRSWPLARMAVGGGGGASLGAALSTSLPGPACDPVRTDTSAGRKPECQRFARPATAAAWRYAIVTKS